MTHDIDQIPRDVPPSTPSQIFDVLWMALVEILGSPTTATLVRRSAKQRLAEYPELGQLAITRNEFEYHYQVPPNWQYTNEQSTAALQALVEALYSLLRGLTGPVVIQRLKTLPRLAKSGVLPSEGA